MLWVALIRDFCRMVGTIINREFFQTQPKYITMVGQTDALRLIVNFKLLPVYIISISMCRILLNEFEMLYHQSYFPQLFYYPATPETL